LSNFGERSPKLPIEGSERGPREHSLALFHDTTALVTYIREARSLRSQFFEAELFGEPGWDILLDLYNAQLGQQKLQVSSIGLSCGIPQTTVIRWLNTLEAKGLIRREPDPVDARRIFVALSSGAVRTLDGMFAALWDKRTGLQLER
jgi:DNA-binding MarR family transcriptional regulator